MSRVATLAVLLLPQVACQKPFMSPGPERATLPLETAEQHDILWDACVDVLMQHNFEIERKDRRDGILTTQPMTSQNAVEFWRRDVATAYDLLESSMHAMRRSVEIRFLAASDHRPHQLQVAVYKEQLHAVEREVNNAAGGLRVFDPDVPSTLGQRFNPKRDAYWSPAGRDSAYEAYLMQRILDRFGEPGPIPDEDDATELGPA